jgi:hypothetical protein
MSEDDTGFTSIKLAANEPKQTDEECVTARSSQCKPNEPKQMDEECVTARSS